MHCTVQFVTSKPSLVSATRDTESVVISPSRNSESSSPANSASSSQFPAIKSDRPTTMRWTNMLSVLFLALMLAVAKGAFETTRDVKNGVAAPDSRRLLGFTADQEERKFGGPATGTDRSTSNAWENFKAWFVKKFFFWRKREQTRRLRNYYSM